MPAHPEGTGVLVERRQRGGIFGKRNIFRSRLTIHEPTFPESENEHACRLSAVVLYGEELMVQRLRV